MTTERIHVASPCARCEQEGTCPKHHVSAPAMRFLRRAREAGQPPPSAYDIYPDYVTPERAAQWREMNRAETATPPPPREQKLSEEEIRWTVRDQSRIRERFGQPHPLDFPGGLPLPDPYPGRNHP